MFFVYNLSLPLPTLECQNLNGGELSSFLDTQLGSPKRMHLKWRDAPQVNKKKGQNDQAFRIIQAKIVPYS
jgi:hypothetical protein